MGTSKQQQFWELHESRKTRPVAGYDDEMYFEPFHCPVNPGHRRSGDRRPDYLCVTLRNMELEDFVWVETGECLLQDRVLEVFRQEGVTGFDVQPVKARFEKSKKMPPPLWELKVRGWSGMAKPESGIRLNKAKCCEACGKIRYTGLTNPSKLMDLSQWDGSDFFIIWPLPRYNFVTDRLKRIIERHHLTGAEFTAMRDLETTDGFGPPRLRSIFPEEQAKRLGEPLGIY